MHSSGWMKSIAVVANSGSSLRGWMQSTGQTSTHAESFVPMHGSVMMNAISGSLHRTGWWLVVGGSWLVVGGWWLVVRGSWLVAGGWWFVVGRGGAVAHQLL